MCHHDCIPVPDAQLKLDGPKVSACEWGRICTTAKKLLDVMLFSEALLTSVNMLLVRTCIVTVKHCILYPERRCD